MPPMSARSARSSAWRRRPNAKQVVALALILRLVLGRSNSSPLDTADARGQAVAQLKGQITQLPVEDASNAMLEKYIAEGTAGFE